MILHLIVSLMLLHLARSQETEQVFCHYKKAFIHHSFEPEQDCSKDPDTDSPLRREIESEIGENWFEIVCAPWERYTCINQGTMYGEVYHCCILNQTYGGHCQFGYSDYSETCGPHEVKFLDHWIIPNGASDDTDSDGISWMFRTVGITVIGLFNSEMDFDEPYNGDIYINGSRVEGVYNYSHVGYETEVGISVETPEDSCSTFVSVWINSTKVVDSHYLPTHPFNLNYYYWYSITSMAVAMGDWWNDWNEHILQVSAFDFVPTQTQIELMYEEGPDRSANFTLEVCDTYLVDNTFLGDQTIYSGIWKTLFYTLTIPLAFVVLVLLLLLVVIVISYLYTNGKLTTYLNFDMDK